MTKRETSRRCAADEDGHVPPSIEDYRRIAGKRRSIVDALSWPGLADAEFDPPRARDLARSAAFS